MMHRRTSGLVPLLLVLILVSGACIAKKVTVGGRAPGPSAGGSGVGGVSAGPPPPCQRVRTQASPQAATERLPAPIAKVAGEVEQVRGLQFKHQLVAEAVSQSKIARMLQQGLDEGFPKDEAARTAQAWTAIGVIPKGTDLRQAVEDFQSSQVVGFYDNEAGRLVIIGTTAPTPYQRFVLAHELTHALQDQNFNLGRVDRLDRTCQDERVEAFLSLIEGDAVETSVEWATQNLTPSEITAFDKEASDFTPPPSSVPAFVQKLLVWPYVPGRTFVQALQARGGEQAVDRAFQNPPSSTEQILHPEKYPAEKPVTVNVPDFGPKLGTGWKDLEFEDVGEGWFRLMLELRLPDTSAEAAAAGWSGAQYRAWTDADGHTAVVLDTAWDTERDASEFAQAMGKWLVDKPGTVLPASGKTVRVLFASDQGTLDRLTAAVSG
jgi:hypothetical protein